jgi:hypothetical protein
MPHTNHSTERRSAIANPKSSIEGMPGQVAPLDRQQNHDQTDAERCQREIVCFQLENRHGNDNGKQGGTGDRQHKRHRERGAKTCGEDSGDIAADAEERRLGQGDRAGMTEHELKSQHQKRIDPAQGQNAQVVWTG